MLAYVCVSFHSERDFAWATDCGMVHDMAHVLLPVESN